MFKKLTVSVFLLCVTTAQAFAAGGHGDHHEASSGGLPQLDVTTYPGQIFWMIVTFVIMHIFFSRKSLPQISKTIEGRTDRIKNDLDTAEKLKDEVEAVQKSYEDSLTGARAEASKLFHDIEADIKARSDKYAKDFHEKSASQINELEKAIVDARKKAMDEMSDVAATIAAEAAEKIIGVRPDDKAAHAVVKSLNEAA